MKLYTELAGFWHLLSDPADYAEEAAHHWRLLAGAAGRPIETILELGCGGGNNALYLKRHARLTLTDLAPPMLDASRSINPECEHIAGDMRSLRLDRAFDAVFVHDAITLMTTEADLRAAIDTAFVHCAPGGAALFVPDCVRETFESETSHGGMDDGPRGIRYLQWDLDPDPADTQFRAEMVYLVREPRRPIRAVQETIVCGLFPEATWHALLEAAGFCASVRPCNYEGAERARSFICTRPE